MRICIYSLIITIPIEVLSCNLTLIFEIPKYLILYIYLCGKLLLTVTHSFSRHLALGEGSSIRRLFRSIFQVKLEFILEMTIQAKGANS